MKVFKQFITIASLLFLLTITFSVNAYASPKGTDETVKNTISGLDAYVRDCKNLNIRKSPSTDSSVLATIPANEHLTVVDQVGKWFEVKYKNVSGYVFWKYIKFTEKKITENEDSTLLGNSIIHYTSSTNRDSNIDVACNIINGTVLQPNKSFVWSEVVGRTTAEKGFLEAPVIINRKSAMGLGGGVCQVSTTIYNALLDTSIVPYELHKHSIGSAYSKNDATVAYGSKDFAFKNSYDFPIIIEAYSYKSVIFVNINKTTE